MIALISARPVVARASGSLEHAAASAWRRVALEWRDGLRVIQRAAVLRALLAFSVITSIGEGLTLTLFVVWVLEALHWDAAGYGWVLSTQAIGGLGALIGASVAGLLGQVIPVIPLLIVQGSGYLVGGTAAWLIVRRRAVATEGALDKAS